MASERLYQQKDMDAKTTGNSTGPHLRFESKAPRSKKVGVIFRTLRWWGGIIHPINREKGFWGEPEFMDKVAGKLALVHSEVTEVLEALRKNQGEDKVTEEFADIFIRCLDLHKVLVDEGLATDDLDETMAKKVEANKNRPPKHGHRWG